MKVGESCCYGARILKALRGVSEKQVNTSGIVSTFKKMGFGDAGIRGFGIIVFSMDMLRIGGTLDLRIGRTTVLPFGTSGKCP